MATNKITLSEIRNLIRQTINEEINENGQFDNYNAFFSPWEDAIKNKSEITVNLIPRSLFKNKQMIDSFDESGKNYTITIKSFKHIQDTPQPIYEVVLISTNSPTLAPFKGNVIKLTNFPTSNEFRIVFGDNVIVAKMLGYKQ